jgi:DNA polymerase III subunit delta
VKASQRDFASIAARAAGAARVFFFCGPDEAGAQDAANRIVGLLSDPGERVELSGADLKRDPVKLDDEARSNSLFGGNRHIWVRASGDEACEALEILLGNSAESCPVLVLASGASDKSRSAKLLADRGDALVAMFHPPDLRSVADAVRTMAGAAGLTFLDARPQAPRSADAAAYEAIGARTEDDGFMPVVNVVLSGEINKLSGELRRIRELGINPVGLLLAIERRAAQLATLAAKLGPRGDVSSLIKQEVTARRIFWKDQRDLETQLRRWRGVKLERLVERLISAHRALLSNSQSAELLLAQELTEITRAAAPRG